MATPEYVWIYVGHIDFPIGTTVVEGGETIIYLPPWIWVPVSGEQSSEQSSEELS